MGAAIPTPSRVPTNSLRVMLSLPYRFDQTPQFPFCHDCLLEQTNLVRMTPCHRTRIQENLSCRFRKTKSSSRR